MSGLPLIRPPAHFWNRRLLIPGVKFLTCCEHVVLYERMYNTGKLMAAGGWGVGGGLGGSGAACGRGDCGWRRWGGGLISLRLIYKFS